jgi:hypothetical protein
MNSRPSTAVVSPYRFFSSNVSIMPIILSQAAPNVILPTYAISRTTDAVGPRAESNQSWSTRPQIGPTTKFPVTRLEVDDLTGIRARDSYVRSAIDVGNDELLHLRRQQREVEDAVLTASMIALTCGLLVWRQACRSRHRSRSFLT